MACIMHENEKKIEKVGPQSVSTYETDPCFWRWFQTYWKTQATAAVYLLFLIILYKHYRWYIHCTKKLPFGCSQGHELKNKMQYLDPIYLLWTTIKSLSAEIHMSKVVKLVAAFWSDLRTYCLKVQVDPPVMHEFI